MARIGLTYHNPQDGEINGELHLYGREARYVYNVQIPTLSDGLFIDAGMAASRAS